MKLTSAKVRFLNVAASILCPFWNPWGGLDEALWARDALVGFWLIWLLNIAPDLIRYARDEQAAKPRAGVLWAAARGIVSTVITIVIIILMATKTNILPA